MIRQTAGTMGVCLLVAGMSAACGSQSVGSSIAPSSVAVAPEATSASTAGVTTAGDRSTGTPAQRPTDTPKRPTDTAQRLTDATQRPADTQWLRGAGVISRVLEGTECPTLTFGIEGDEFTVSSDTRYDNGRCDDLEVGARVAWAGAKRAHDSDVLVTHVKFAPLSR